MDVLLIEDDPVHRAFLKEVIELALPECTRLLEAEDGLAGERLAHEYGVTAVVMDLQMPRRTGVEAAKTIWRDRPDTSILFWSNYADEAYVRGISRIVPEGAAYGYVLKTASEERLRLALRTAVSVHLPGMSSSELATVLECPLVLMPNIGWVQAPNWAHNDCP